MTDSEDEQLQFHSFRNLPIPYTFLRDHMQKCREPRCLADAFSTHGGAELLGDAAGERGEHWLQLQMPRTRSVVYYPEEPVHDGHTADRESILVTHATLRLTCSCSRPACCLPSLLNRLCATYNCCAFDHEVSQHKGHLSSDEARYHLTFGNWTMAPSKVTLISSLIKTAGLLLAMIIAGLAGYLTRSCSCPSSPPPVIPPRADNTTLPLTVTVDTGGPLTGLEIVLLCAILAVTLGALACLFRPTISILLERYFLASMSPPLLKEEQGGAGEETSGGGGPAGIEHELRPPSPLHVRLN